MCFAKSVGTRRDLKDCLLFILHHYLQNLVGMMHEAVESLRLSRIAFFTGLLSRFILNYQDGDIVICRVSQIYLTGNKMSSFILFPQNNFSLVVS